MVIGEDKSTFLVVNLNGIKHFKAPNVVNRPPGRRLNDLCLEFGYKIFRIGQTTNFLTKFEI